MRGQRTYTADRRACLQRIVWLLVLAAPAWGQVTISSVQSSFVGANFPNNVQGITSGAQLPGNGFILWVNGSFPNAAAGTNVQWFNPNTGVTFSATPAVTVSQLQVFIPENLYLTPVGSTQTVQITVTQGVSQATGTFFVNAPLASVNGLQLGTVGVVYNSPLFNGGTPPYSSLSSGTVPTGLSINASQALVGTPTTPGVFPFTPTVTDQWNQSLTRDFVAQIVGPASISTITPNSAPAGAGIMQIDIAGTNFVNPATAAGGSIVQWKFSSVTAELLTTYNSDTSLSAIVPTALMSAAGTASIAILQPDDTISPPKSFPVLAPSISTLNPTSTPAGVGVTLTVSGANFADRTAAPDAVGIKVPQIQFGSTLLQGQFLDSATVRVVIPAGLVPTQGPITVSEVNPGGSTSNGVTFNVSPPPTISAPTATLTFNYSVGAANPPSQLVAVSGNNPGLTFTAVAFSGADFLTVMPASGTAPADVTVSINGTGLAPGSYPGLVSIAGTGGALGTSVVPVTLNVFPALGITALGPQLGTTGTTYSLAATATGGVGAYTWSATGLPSGLGINALTGAITGTPLSTGSFPAQIKVTDSQGTNIQTPVTFTIISPATISSISPNAVPAGSGLLQITINGANFVDTLVPFGASVAQFNFGRAGSAALATTFVSTNLLRATIPTALMSLAGPQIVSVLQPDGVNSSTLPFTLAAPAINSLSPSTILAGGAGFLLTINGSNFADRSAAPDAVGIKLPQIQFGGSLFTATFVNATTLTVPIPAGFVNSPGPIIVSEINPGGSASNPSTFTVTSTLAITSLVLPSGTSGTPYSARVAAIGGFGAYTWTASGLPPGLLINPQTGDIAGTPQISGTFPLSVRVTDGQGTNVTALFTITINLPPPTISTPSILSSGMVGTPYQATIGVGSGGGPFTFALSGGSLPDGLSLTSNGLIFGTPSKAGTFSFTITASDPLGNAPSKSFTITIAPAPLTLPGSGTTTATSGTPVNIDLTPAGGTPPYRYTVNCTLPPGLTFNNGIISGTPTTPGTYTCRVVIADGGGSTVTKDITITVAAPALAFKGSTLANGQVGVSYTGSVAATGGTPPLTYSGSGLPDGLSFASSGAISGTPGTEGTFSLSATATDAAGATASASFSITIEPAKLTLTTASLPDGVAGAGYSASLAAAGGVKPYAWTVGGLPGGVSATSTGVISGTPNAPGKFTVTVTAKDNAGAMASGSFIVTIAPAALVITTASAAGGTAGTAYSASFAAGGGVPPFTWSATGLPPGLTMSPAGAISGTPTAPGTSNATVTVRDSVGTSTSKAFSIVIALPATPPLTFAGVSATTNPLQQPRLTVGLGTTFPVDVTVTLTLTFTPDAGGDDPSIVFSTGGRTARITVPAGSASGSSDAGVQTGSVAGLITIVAQMQAAGLDVTPSPAPRQTIRINPAAPVMTTVAATRTGTGFNVSINGYVTDREITQAVFTFNAAAGSSLQTTSLTVAVDTLFTAYFGGTGAAPFGSQFTFTQPFTVSGNSQAIASVTVTLVNKIGNSTMVTVNLN